MSTNRRGLKRPVELSSLEARMLFDGAGLVTWEASTDTAPPAAEPPATPTQIVFISPEVAGKDQFVQAFGPDAAVITLEAGSDGIGQISAALAGRSGIEAIHIVSHGSEGYVALPGMGLDAASLTARAADIAAWSGALGTSADIVLYGCDVAASPAGVALADALAALTGADVGASRNDTGGGPGADWRIEYSSGPLAASMAAPLAYTDRLATVNLSGSTGWTAIMLGTNKDPQGDSQAGAADTDIIGDATHGSLYTAYDDNGTAATGDDTLAFRMRIDNPTSTTNFAGVAIVGMDANLDGRVDLFFSVDGRNNGRAVRLLDPGTGANLSPSTTSTAPLPTGWLPNNGVYAFSASNYAVLPVSAATDPNWGPSSLPAAGASNTNLSGAGGADAFISWRVPIADIALVLAKPSAVDRSGNAGPRGTTGIAGYGKDTVVQYINFTQTQTGPINGDLNGVGASYDKNASFASIGAFTTPMTASAPVSDGLSISVAEPVGDGNLSAGEAAAVTLNGITKAPAGSTVSLTVTDSGAGSVNASATVMAGLNGVNTWSASNVNLSALADGSLTVSAAVTSAGSTVTDTATVLLDKSAPAIGIDQLAGTTAGKPLLTGTAAQPDGAVVTLTLDSDNNPATANLIYDVVVSGGVWSLNTATAAPRSGSMPGAGLSASTRIGAVTSDAAGNSASALALNRPSVATLVTGSTSPTISGSWTFTAGDTLSVALYADAGGAPGALLATYTLAPAGDAWSVNLASATMDGGGTLGALTPDRIYHVAAQVTRGGMTVGDTTSAELNVVGGAAIDILDTDGVNDDIVTLSQPRPVFNGTSSVLSGVVAVTIDPAGNGSADAIVYAVPTNGSGAWQLDTATLQPVQGFMPAAGLSGAAVVTATTGLNASGQSATNVQNITVVIPRIVIGSAAGDGSGIETSLTTANNNASANVILGDRILNALEDNSVVISGSTTDVAPGSTVSIVVSDGSTSYTKTTTVQANGSWTLLAASAGTANDGNALDLSSLKSTGLTVTASVPGASAQKSVTHDAIAPQIVLTAPSVIKTSSAAATGNASLPAGAQVLIATTEGQSGLVATVNSDGDFSTPLALSGNGSVTITATSSATDAAGNKVAPATQTVTFQNPNVTPPLVSIGAITGITSTDTTITSGEISAGVTISGTFANTATISSGTLTLSITDGSITKTQASTGVTLTRNNAAGTWSAVLTKNAIDDFGNGTLVITAQLADTVGSGGGTAFVVKDAAQPLLYLVSGTASVSINQPVDPNGLVNASEDDAVTFTGNSVNAAGGALTLTVSDGTATRSGSATVADDGSWSVAGVDLSGLADGTLTVSVTVDPDRDAGTANSASASTTVIHDKTAPLLHIGAAATVANSLPLISGSASGLASGAPLTVTIDTNGDGTPEATYSTTVQSGGAWSVQAAIPTPVGSRITASASDPAGNASAVVASSIASIGTDSGTSATDFITNDSTLVFSGSATPLATVTVKLDGVTIGTPSANAAGVWTLDYQATPVANGNHTLTAQTTAAGGNTALATQAIVVDVASVAIASISADTGVSASDFLTGDNTLVYAGTASAGAQVTVRLTDSGGALVFERVASATGGNWSLDMQGAPALADGAYTLAASVTDASGVSSTATRAFTVDTGAQIGITSNYKSRSGTPLITGSTDIEAGRTLAVSVAIDGGATWTYSTTVAADGSWSVNTASALPGGSAVPISYANGAVLTIGASGSDAAGNNASAAKGMLIDTSAPTISITTALDYTGSNSPNGILVAAEDTNVVLRGSTVGVPNGGVVQLTITDGSMTISDTTTVGASSWQLAPLNLRALANGTITVVASYTDESGNTYSDVATVLHDKSATGTSVSIDRISADSNVAGDFITSDNTLVFSGSAAPGAVVSLTLADGWGVNQFPGALTVLANASGTWTYDFSGTTLADDNYLLTAVVGAGTPAYQSLVVDTSMPAGAVTVTNPVVTADTTPDLGGTAVVAAGETLSVTVNGKTYTAGGGALSLAGGNWTLTIPAADALTPASAGAGFDGVYQVVASIRDAAGNLRADGSSNELTVQDTLAPVLDLAPADGATIHRSATSVNGAAVSLDNNADPLTLVEAGDRLASLTLAVGGLQGADGANEKLVFGGTSVAANGSDAGSVPLADIVVGGVRVNIAYNAGVFTVQKYTYAPLSTAEVQAVARAIDYRNDAGNASTAGVRTFAFGTRDDAGNAAASAIASITVSAGAAAPTQTVAITSVTDDVAPVTGSVASGASTNDTSPALAGTLSATLGANEVVGVYRGGVRIGTATTIGTGWTYADSGLANATTYAYTAQVENTVTAASGSASAAYSIAIDTSAPAQTVAIVSMSKDTGSAGDFITSDGSANRSVAGTLSAVLGSGETLEVSVDGGTSWNPATVLGTAWSINDPVLHNAGWTISTRIVDAAGNLGGAASQAVTLAGTPAQAVAITSVTDDVAPVTGTVASGAATNDSSPALAGTLSATLGAGEVLGVYRDGVRIGAATTTGTGWTYADSGLANGSAYSYTARVENSAAGTLGAASAAYTISIDTSAPAQTVAIVSMSKDSGTPGDFITTDGSANRSVAGTLSAVLGGGETLEVSVDGGTSWSAATVLGTAWSFNDPVLHNASWTISTRIVDAAGNLGGASSQAVTLANAPGQTVAITSISDDVAPLTGIIPNGGTSNDTSPLLAGTLSAGLGANEVVGVWRGGVRIGSAAVNGTAWTYADSGLANAGTYVYSARVENTVAATAGASAADYSIGIDTSAPAQTVAITVMSKDSGAPNDFITVDGSAGRSVAGTLSAALAAGESLQVSFDGGATWQSASVAGTAWSIIDNSAHSAGWTIAARVADAAGNTGAAASQAVNLSTATLRSASISTVTDDVAPLTGIVANGGVTNDLAPQLSGSVSAPLAANEVVGVYRNGVRAGSATVNGTAWTFADAGLAGAGSYAYTVRVEDNLNGSASAFSSAYQIGTDTSAPAQSVTIDTMTRDSGVAGDFITSDGAAGRTVSGTLSAVLGAGETLEVSFDGGASWQSATVSGTGWSIQDNTVHASSWTIATRLLDAAGNQGAAASRAVTLLAAPLQSVIISAITDDVAAQTGVVASGGASNDTAPLLSGSLSAALANGQVLAVLRDGVRIGTANASGTAWTYADSGLADGASYSYTARVENASGDGAGALSPAYSLAIDTSAPAQTVQITAMDKDTGVAGDFITADGSAGRTVSGTLSAPLAAGERLEISVDGGTSWQTALVSGSGWSIQDAAVHTSSWQIGARLVDAAGNSGAVSSRAATLLAPPLPDTSITSLFDDVGAITGTIPNGGTSNDGAPLVAGSITAALGSGETVGVFRNGTRIGSASVNGTAWTYADSGLQDGATYVYTARVESASANGAASPAYSMTVDTSAPAQLVTIVSMSADTGTAGDFITTDGRAGRTVSGGLSAALAPGELLEVSSDGGATWTRASVSGLAWEAPDALAHPSSWTISTRLLDAAGNSGPVRSQAVTLVPATPQTVRISAVTDDVAADTGTVPSGGATNDNAPRLDGTLASALEPGATLGIYRNGVRVGAASVNGTAWSFTDTGLADGAYSYSAVAESAGQPAASDPYLITVDRGAPTQTITIQSMTRDSGTPGDFVTSDGAAGRAVGGSLSAPLAAGELLEVSMDGGLTWQTAQVNGNSWSATDGAAHTAGWTIVARLRDGAGNSGASVSRAVTLEAPSPGQSVAITSITDDVPARTGVIANGGSTNDTAPLLAGTVSGALSGGQTLGVYRNGVRIGSAAVNGTAWTYADSALADGASYTYSARVEEGAASGPAAPAYAIVLDTGAPAQLISIGSMDKDTGAADFSTTDGSAGRTVRGTLSGALAPGEVLEVSVDGGASWGPAAVAGTTWTALDNTAHSAAWTIQARLADAAGNTGATAIQAVNLAAPPLPDSPPVINEPVIEPVIEPVTQPVTQPVADASAPLNPASVPVAALPGAPAADSVPASIAPAPSLAPGAPADSTGLPPPAVALVVAAPADAFAAPTARTPQFEMNVGGAVNGTSDPASVLSGADIGTGFSINVRQNDGGVASKDSLKLVQATVRIDAGLVAERDLLVVTGGAPNITASYDPVTGTLTLTGLASAEDYERVIQGIKLRDRDGGDVKNKRTIRITIKAESGQTQNGTKEYRGPVEAPPPPRDGAENTPAPAPAGKTGLLAQLAKAHGKQHQGRDQFIALAERRGRDAA